MPIHFRCPSPSWVNERLSALDGELSYPEVGATSRLEEALPAALRAQYDVDHHRVVVGHGRATFERAWEALSLWRQFEVGWARLEGADAPAHEGQVVGTLVSFGGVWLLNPCRVVYVKAPAADDVRGAVGYGTFPGHVESGEERFCVTIDPQTERVEYEIAAFSRPAHVFTRLGYPVTRVVQRRFARATGDAVLRVVSE
jgi:uncharacterized protein (UPF0548 family)